MRWFIASILGGVVAGFFAKKNGFLVSVISGFIFVTLPFFGTILLNFGSPEFHSLFNDLGNPAMILIVCGLNILLTGLTGLIIGKKFSN